MGDDNLTFWEHLDILRNDILRILLAATVAAVAAFSMKEWLFQIVLAPRTSDFFVYRLIGGESFSLHLINTGLAEQFMIHMKVAAVAGLVAASPYIIYILFRFVSPALYPDERKASRWIVIAAYLMFLLGIAVCYVIVFPLTVRFLGTYQVSTDIDNMLTLSSYVDTLLGMSLVFGVVFELPVVCFLMACFGLLRSSWMSRYRRHAIVAILIVAAVITPTADIFTLLIVSLPIWLLYEVSVLIVKAMEGGKNRSFEISKKR